ncbi:type IX secretion system motor protein PorM/GldM [Mucilaginibacter antarcticus]|uniref:Gliding motility protein GldM n=1 Tax=Mucilaginibacter antarcticus TaxID=1855725 RepID=A0ABW5XM54_9SPHI
MAGGKETPRQRMIGILYLVLLGLVAMNVPDSLLDAFRNITNSLDSSRKNVITGIDNTYSAFEKTKLKEQPERAKPVYAKAKEASRVAAELDKYIEELKAVLIKEGGGINPEINDVNARDDLDISPRIMVQQKKADKLRKLIDDTRDKLLGLLSEKERTGVNFSLNAVDPPKHGDVKKTWQEANFGDGIPLGASLTTLAKIQADAKNAENEIVKKILGEVDQAVVNLDQFNAVAVAPTSYVLVGQPYTAEVFLTASDSRSNPTITANGSPLPVESGKGKYTVVASKEGVYTWIGRITYKKTDGTTDTKQVSASYTVARPSAVVSPDAMNVLYIGVPNPVSISAPGIAKKDLRVSMSGGNITPSGNGYTVTVSNMGTATVNVSGEVSKGRVMVLGSTKFRVKRIPDPKAQLAGKSGGKISAANIKAQEAIFANLENFEFNAKFNVTRFTMVIIRPRQDAQIVSGTGNQISGQIRTAMNNVVPGSTVVFRDIMAVGPDGSQRGLDDIIFTVN